MELKNELVIMAPIQVKKSLSPGNIYDLTLIDFYAKTRRLQGSKIHMPLFWNVNGLPVLRMMQRENIVISNEKRKEFIDKCIQNGVIALKKHYINFDEQIRDDEISLILSDFIGAHCQSNILKGSIPIATCKKCGSDFGTDNMIKLCKICGSPIEMQYKDILYQEISRDEILKRVYKINIYPIGAKKELIAFCNSMPEKYNICLTKKREYTITYDGFSLDPRFIVMLTPALVQGIYSKRVYFHGDIIKKFSYYSLCHLPSKFLPTNIICHGVLLDKHGRKIKWQDHDEEVANLFNELPPSDLRAFSLKRNVVKDVIIDFDIVKNNLREQEILRERIDNILKYEHFSSLSVEFINLKKELLEAVNNFFYGVAYDKMVTIVKLLENKLPQKSIHPDEILFLNELRFLYFGQYYGIKN